jgi:hypothetical protein
MKNAVFLDVGPCRYYVNQSFGGTSVHTISTQRNIPEDGILQCRISLMIAYYKETYSGINEL